MPRMLRKKLPSTVCNPMLVNVNPGMAHRSVDA
jgi:hypothetical protein